MNHDYAELNQEPACVDAGERAFYAEQNHRHEALRHAVHLAGLSPGATIESTLDAATQFYNFLSGMPHKAGMDPAGTAAACAQLADG